MRRNRILSTAIHAFLLGAALGFATGALAAPKYKVLHAFGSGNDGAGVWGGLARDTEGNLYGTTSAGGANDGGTVFELTPTGPNGEWSEAILHNFPTSPRDGAAPVITPVVDAAGNIYGMTAAGGVHDASGVAFRLASGSRTEKILYEFCARPKCGDGGTVQGNLLRDQQGNLYAAGGAVFELLPRPGKWKDIALRHFTCGKGDGCEPYDLAMDASGNLYGINQSGGKSKECGGGCGTTYELQRTVGGKWKLMVLHDFGTGNDNMGFPTGVLALDGAGNVYGIAGGGAYESGAVYRLSPNPDGRWKASIQYSFAGGKKGSLPSGGLVIDATGNLYGITQVGGDPNCQCGLVYKLTPKPTGGWTYTVLHRFTGYDGAEPAAPVTLDGQGNVYGTTATGGAGGAGVAFEITP
jgi:uncharacterized repeat protein (TIGR03803 family)